MKKLINIIYKGINKIINFLNIDLKKKIPNIETLILEGNGKVEPIGMFDESVKVISSFGITAEEMANNINKLLAAALGNNSNSYDIPYETELKQERSDFFDQSKYK